jgi:DNA-binding phage protein
VVLTRDFKKMVMARAQREPEFRTALLTEAVECILTDELDTAKSLLRDYINATIGFQELGELIQKEPKSLMRMLGKSGNPRLENISALLASLTQHEGIELHVEVK